MTRVTVVGDTFLDVDWTGTVDRVCPDAPAPVLDAEGEQHRAGGAGLAARLATAEGAEVTFVTALGADAEGERLRADLEAAGVALVDLGLQAATPVKLRVRAAGQSLVRVDRNCTPVAAVGPWPDTATAAIDAADAVLVSDYGRGMAGVPALVALLHTARHRVPVVWDPHLRGPRPLAGLDLLTPNLDEALRLGGPGGRPERPRADLPPLARAADGARALSREYDCAVAVTAGEAGAALAEPGREPLVVPVDPVAGDACGAGDRFAAAAVVVRARGRSRTEAIEWATEAARRHVAAGDDGLVVAPHPVPSGAHARADRGPGGQGNGNGARSRSAISAGSTGSVISAGSAISAGEEGRAGSLTVASHPGDVSEAVALAEATRAAGRTVVVAGGCFDVIHAGHVRLLEAARRMGDCLIVCLNGDLSVRRLKGPHRPVNRIADRELVLGSLGSVDAVEVFEDDTPCEALRRLRPHVFVKGADHAGPLPEHEVMAGWGGRIVFVPLVEGRSTTRILHHVAAAVG